MPRPTTRLNPDTQNHPDSVQVYSGFYTTLLNELPRQDLDALTIDAGGGNDILMIDLANGNPLRDGALTFNAGSDADSDWLLINGQSTLTASILPSPTANRGGSAIVGGREMAFTGVEDIAAANLDALSLITPNADDDLSIDSTSGSNNRISGTSGSVNLSRLTFSDTSKVVLDLAANDDTAGDDSVDISDDGMVATGLDLLKVIAGAGDNALTVNGGTTRLWSTVDGGTLDVTVSAGATLDLAATQRLRTLDIQGESGNPSLVNLPTDSYKLLTVETLNISDCSTVNIGTSDILIDYTGSSPVQDVRNQLIAGFGPNSNWQGSHGFITNATAIVHGLGYGEVSALNLGGAYHGQSVDSTAILIRYTRRGDATLNDWVDSTDTSAIASHWEQSVNAWTDGDLNYDGVVNLMDLSHLGASWTAGTKPTLTFQGASTAAEGNDYQLSLSAPATYQVQVQHYDENWNIYYTWDTYNYDPITWHIFWGDEDLSTTTGFTATLEHSYDSPGEKTIYIFGLQSGLFHFAGTKAVAVGDTPAAPTDLSATAISGHEIDLAWTDNSSIETGFQIAQSPDGTSDWSPIAWPDANTQYYSLPGPFAPETDYYFRVQALTDSAESAYSNTATVTTAAFPPAPTDLVATATSDTDIDLTWTDNSSGADITLQRSDGRIGPERGRGEDVRLRIR